GALTERVVGLMNRHGRLLSYGSAAAFYAGTLAAPQSQRQTLRQAFGLSGEIEAVLKQRNIKSSAWIVSDFYHERPRAEDDLSRLMLSGVLKAITNVVEGFENVPAAVAGLYEKGHAGKLQVRF